jgi:hypothetical protein
VEAEGERKEMLELIALVAIAVALVVNERTHKKRPPDDDPPLFT